MNSIGRKAGSLFTTDKVKDTRLIQAWYDVYDIQKSPEFLSTYDGNNNIANAVKVVLEADKILFFQFLIHLFATLNALIEGVVAKNFKQAIRTQCIIAIILIKFIDILCSITLSPTRGLGNVDVNDDMLQDTKQIIQKAITMNDGYILMYACLAFLCGPNIGSSIPLLISQIPFYTKYFALLTSAGSSASLDNIITVLSSSLPSFANHARKELKYYLPKTTEKETSKATAKPTADKSLPLPLKLRKVKSNINIDDETPLIDIATVTAELESSSDINGTSTSTTVSISHQKQDILESICNNAFLAFESIYFFNYITSFIRSVANHSISGFVHLFSQFFLSFLVIQYLIVRTKMHGSVLVDVVQNISTMLTGNQSSAGVIKSISSSIDNIRNKLSSSSKSSVKLKKKSKSIKKKKSVVVASETATEEPLSAFATNTSADTKSVQPLVSLKQSKVQLKKFTTKSNVSKKKKENNTDSGDEIKYTKPKSSVGNKNVRSTSNSDDCMKKF